MGEGSLEEVDRGGIKSWGRSERNTKGGGNLATHVRIWCEDVTLTAPHPASRP